MPKWLLGYVSAAVVVGSIVAVQNIWDLSKSDWASWAQAIGTVAAVAGAVWVARYQAHQDRRREEERDEKALLAAYGLLQSIVWRLNSATRSLAVQLSKSIELEEYLRRCERRDEFENIYAAALELPVHKLPDFDAVSCLLDTRQLAKNVLSHSHAYVEGENIDRNAWCKFRDEAQEIHEELVHTIKCIRYGLH